MEDLGGAERAALRAEEEARKLTQQVTVALVTLGAKERHGTRLPVVSLCV